MQPIKRITTALCLFLGACLGLTGCTMAPAYIRPDAPVPAAWPSGPAYQQTVQPSGQAVADLPWPSFFTDSRLRGLIRLALENNRNLRIAALNIEKVQAQYRIQRSGLFPKIDAAMIVNNQAANDQKYSVFVGVSAYELDLFGRVRSLKDQALEQYLATEQAGRTVRISLVAEVAVNALTLAAGREGLQLAQETLKTRQSSLELIQRRFEVGASSELDLRQAQTLVDSARLEVARATTRVAQDENILNLVVGSTVPSELLPNSLSEFRNAVQDIAPGLPSSVLLRRPDILEAENLLKGFNANIGAARAAFFPRIVLLSTAGVRSDELSGLFKSGSDVWTFSPQIILPIFDAGTRSAELKVAEVDRDIAVARYEQAIQTGFREVADALAQRGTIDEQVAAQESLLASTSASHLLSQARFDAGIDSYLNVLDAQRSLYSAQQGVIATRLARLANLVTLYKVLGGGGTEELIH